MLSLQSQIVWCKRAQWTLGVATLVLVSGFYLLGYRPQTRRLNELSAQVAMRQRELRESQSKTRILPSVAAEVERLRVRLEKYKALPRQQELPQFFKDIAQLGQQAALKKFDYKPRGLPTRGEQFSDLPVQLTFEGDFVNVFSFLRHTEELQRLTRVRGMSIKSKDRRGQVNVQLAMDIYFAAE